MRYPIKQIFLSSPSKRASGKPIDKVRFLVAHDTGNEGSTARANVMYYERTKDDQSASAHIFVDSVEIIECIPAIENPKKAWHVLYDVLTDDKRFGTNANDSAIGIELCYGGQVNNLEAYRKYVWILAYLCYKYKLNPLLDIVGHSELDPKRKTDPENALKHINKSLDDLLEDVQSELEICKGSELNEMDELLKRIEKLESQINQPVPEWAKASVDAAVKSGLIANPNVYASQDFYRLLVILHRKKML